MNFSDKEKVSTSIERNSIYCIDCLEGLKLLDDNSVNLIVTSPPYNLGGMKKGSMFLGQEGETLTYSSHKDDMSDKRYIEWQKEVLTECWKKLKDNGAIFYNHKYRIIDKTCDARLNLIPANVKLRQIIIWNRGTGINFSGWFFLPRCEVIFLMAKKNYKVNKEYVKLGDVWQFPPDISPHPASFPLELPRRCILSSTKEGDLVVDPFVGWGTTAVASKELNRDYIGFDNSSEYCKKAKERLSQKTIGEW